MGCAEGGSWDGVQKVQKQGRGYDGYCELAGPPGRCASVLEFCLVFCTVSALTQSSLWLLNFALDSIVLPCPLNGAVAVDERRGGETVPGAARLLSPWGKLVLGRLCLELGGTQRGRGVAGAGAGTLGCPALTCSPLTAERSSASPVPPPATYCLDSPQMGHIYGSILMPVEGG